MITYISILRGINVSGKKIIKMNDLRKIYENLGLINVKTYLQSGNVIFQYYDNKQNTLEQKISEQIKSEFGFEVPVIVLTINNLSKVISNNLFKNDLKKDNSNFYVTFLASEPINYNIEEISFLSLF